MDIDINVESRTEKGRENILKAFANATNGIDRTIDEMCWAMYNNSHNLKEYDYLRKYGDYELPAHVRHIPIQRPYCEFLTSRHINQPFNFWTSAIDKTSLVEKHDNQLDKQWKFYEQMFNVRYNSYTAKIQTLEMQRQQLVQQLQLQPQTPEQQNALQQGQMMLPQINAAIDSAIQQINDMQVMDQKIMDNLKMAQRYTDREVFEQWAQIACRSLRQRNDIKSKSTQNFIANIVTGKEYWFVDYDYGTKRMIIKSLLPHKVFFQECDDVRWTQDLDWVGYEEYLTPTAIISELGNRLSADERKSITSRGTNLPRKSEGPFVATSGGRVVDMGREYDGSNIGAGNIGQENGIKIKRVWWIAERPITFIKTPNQYRKGKYFYNILPSDKGIVDRKDYFYNPKNRTWTNREDNNQVYKNEEVKDYDSRKGQEAGQRITYDRYKGVIIDDRIYLSEKDQIQPRGIDNLSRTWLPIVGPTFNDISNQPYSYIWATKDLQKSYNIVNYHQELMLAVAGVKAVIMDKVQKPEGMSDQEWEYNLKMGRIYIESRKKGIGVPQPTFNQFQVFDMSLSNSIQYLDLIMQSIDNRIGLIMGVTRQAMGQVQNTDQVGTFQLSQQSTLLITEALYNRHDEIEAQMMTLMLRLAKEHMFNEDTILQVLGLDGSENLVKIPRGILRKRDFDILIQRNAKEQTSLMELKQLALNNFKAGILPYHNFVAMYNTESVKELEKMSIYFSEQAFELQQKSRQAEIEGDKQKQIEVEEKKAQLQQQIKEYEEKIKQQTEALKLQWEQTSKESEDAFKRLELELKNKELEIKQQELEQNKYLKLYELTNTKQSEDNVIMENARATNLDTQIKMIELELQAMETRFKKDTDDKKVNVEDKKARKMVKEYTT